VKANISLRKSERSYMDSIFIIRFDNNTELHLSSFHEYVNWYVANKNSGMKNIICEEWKKDELIDRWRVYWDNDFR